MTTTDFGSGNAVRAYYDVKLSNGEQDYLSFEGCVRDGQLFVKNGEKWYMAKGSLCPDFVIDLNKGKKLTSIDLLAIGATRDI